MGKTAWDQDRGHLWCVSAGWGRGAAGGVIERWWHLTDEEEIIEVLHTHTHTLTHSEARLSAWWDIRGQMGRAWPGFAETAVIGSTLTASHLLHIMSATAHSASRGNLRPPPRADLLRRTNADKETETHWFAHMHWSALDLTSSVQTSSICVWQRWTICPFCSTFCGRPCATQASVVYLLEQDM